MGEGGDKCVNENTKILLTGIDRRETGGLCYSMRLGIKPYEQLTDSKTMWQYDTLSKDFTEFPTFETFKANVGWQ